ncbi:hypothetical protein GTA21_10130 [Roseobacter sp. HKCCD7106]|nr:MULTISPECIES: hypothetical protein [unclassified Roseobacter]NOA91729.1 hypothetical protein [Roseobacter sp. HKCCD7561]NOB43985.1 hypothetical protein [Roseobacter sp. HKCCD7371]NOC74648.1 hypothetical protein [Roseobacter sp. HKCCD7372]NPT81487.1 hypothetical protein [Roseobacter sp. HKCCD7106]
MTKVSVAPKQAKALSMAVRRFPSMVSPVACRKDGCGYETFDPDDAAMVAELRRQGGQALMSWRVRDRGMAGQMGVDASAIEEVSAQIQLDRSKAM